MKKVDDIHFMLSGDTPLCLNIGKNESLHVCVASLSVLLEFILTLKTDTTGWREKKFKVCIRVVWELSK